MSKSLKSVDHTAEAKAPAYTPPPYAPPYSPPANALAHFNRRPHTNPVIEAGHVRARDEVRFTLTLMW
jgi:hypothetical protein